MKIIDIQSAKKRSMFRIQFDSDYILEICKETLLTFQLKAGMEIDESTVEEVRKFDINSRLKEQAFRYLKQRAHSSNELKRKLIRKGFEEEDVEPFIQTLLEQNILNDRDFLSMFIHDRVEFSRKGSYFIINELKQKGFPEGEIIPVLRQFLTPERELDQAIKLAQKKWDFYRNKEKAIRIQKVYQFLGQKGYPINIIKNAIEHIIEERMEGEDFNEY